MGGGDPARRAGQAGEAALLLDTSVAAAAVATASKDIRVTMPPHPFGFDGLEAIAPLLEHAFGVEREGDWRLVPTIANRMPTPPTL